MPEVRKRWQHRHGKPPNKKDVLKMFEHYVPAQIACLPEYSEIIPGTREAVDRLRNGLKLKIGITTGFTRPMAKVLLNCLHHQGFDSQTPSTLQERYQ